MERITTEVKKLSFFKHHKVITGLLLILSIFLYLNFTKFNSYVKNTDTKDPHFINELYKSDNRIYNDYLTDKEKNY